MSNKATHVTLLSFIIIQIILGIYLYPRFPELVTSHWNAQGEADGYMSKFWGVFLVPMIMMLMYVLYIVIPIIEPRTQNIAEFRKTFNKFWVGLFIFFFYISILTTLWNLGIHFDFTYALMPAMGILFYFLGSQMQETKRNFFMGIRTPWTLSSDVVWNKTHKLGGKLFKLSGVLTLVAVLISGTVAVVTLIASVMLSAVISVVYSYKEFKKLENGTGVSADKVLE